ncbi:tyrosine-type recombinase/integrase [Sphingobium lignivorans]|uniref:Integrase n=1 Tax=Sphingobium lignivorans TaxID=2735886 RepID=A0ABR6NFS2_9SPHN|nr:site-specific integrase [Sphingobium lignivorans]MBB5986134.1 integrase [Sphingobium lignivorans]
MPIPLSNYDVEGKRKYLTRAETSKFIAAAKDEDVSVYFFCWFIATTGCRVSEALMVTRRSVDFEAGLVIIESLKKRRTGVFRAVPLPSAFLQKLSKWFDTKAIQPQSRLWPWSRMTAYRRVKTVMDRAGVEGPWATPKGLRHAFGVRAVQSGVPLHIVQRWLGHADMKTTAIYAGAVGPEERDLASRVWLDQEKPRRPSRSPSLPAASPPHEGMDPSVMGRSLRLHETPAPLEDHGNAGHASSKSGFEVCVDKVIHLASRVYAYMS